MSAVAVITGAASGIGAGLARVAKARGLRLVLVTNPVGAFLPANPTAIDAGFEVRKIFKDLDYATLQGYDYHGTWEPLTNQQSALRVPRGVAHVQAADGIG